MSASSRIPSHQKRTEISGSTLRPECLPKSLLSSNNRLFTAFVASAKTHLQEASSTALRQQSLLTDGFDVDQIWEQAKVFLKAVEKSINADGTFPQVRQHRLNNYREASAQRLRRFGQSASAAPTSFLAQSYEGEEEEEVEDGDGEREGKKEEEEEEDGGQGDDKDATSDDIRETGSDHDSDDHAASETSITSFTKDGDLSKSSGMVPKDNNRAQTSRGHYSDNVDGGNSSGLRCFPKVSLDDGFFSLERFNRETEMFEMADESGLPIDDDDDKEEVDWNSENMTDTEEYADEAHPTPGQDQEHGLMYHHFFEPPAQSSRSEKRLAVQNQSAGSDELDLAGDMNTIAESMDHDLFDERGDINYLNGLIEAGVNTPTNLSVTTHEARQNSLKEQIRRLEAENVKKKDWTLTGEARAQQRPFNSLLEHDLDFERSGKSIPVITQDVSIALEDMIRSRIISGTFDDLPRRHPDEIARSARTFRPDLDDSKSRSGLAEVYEADHSSAGLGLVNEAKDAPLKDEIALLFTTVTRQLDSLSAWQFTPKAPTATLVVAQDKRTISLEEANLNTGALPVSHTSTLAPQDVYKPMDSGETHGRTPGIPISGQELQKEERAREHRRRKRLRRRDGATTEAPALKTKRASEDAVIRKLQTSSATVIGRHGERVPVSGKASAGQLDARSSGSRLKL